MIEYKCTTSEVELTQILELQVENLPINISKDTYYQEGFVTLTHDLTLLKIMNGSHPHIVATQSGSCIGYALITIPEECHRIPLLQSTVDGLAGVIYRGHEILKSRYFIMGQVCIAYGHRGQGVFQGLYNTLIVEMKGLFDFIVTEIDLDNKRSMRAHEKLGFEIVKVHKEGRSSWATVILDIRSYISI